MGTDTESKKLRNFRRHASGVSRALWPDNMRRSPATDRATRQRRSLTHSGKWRALLAYIYHMRTSGIVVSISLFVGSTIAVALVSRWWYVLLIPTALLTTVSLLVTPPFLVKLYRTFHPAALQPSREWRGLPFSPGMRRSLETPLPAAPLVRVLETFELSQTTGEHFLEASQSNEYAPSEFSLEKEC